MNKNMLKSIIVILMIFSLTGCWDYVGLDEMTITTGIAIDKDEKTNEYKLSYEIVNLDESTESKSVKTEIVESTGATIFDAMRNTKKRLMNKLYFANVQVVVVSKKIAENDGINSIINWFLRDAEIRETINFVISENNTAKEILATSCVDSPITAYQIKSTVRDDNSVISSTKDIELYKIYNVLKSDSSSLALPVFHITVNNNKSTVEADGIATFKKDKLIGYLNPSESKYYLFIDNNVDGGILVLKSNDSATDNISLEISNNLTSKSYSYKNEKFKIIIETDTDVYIGEYDDQSKTIDEKTINSIQKKAEELIEKNIKDVISKAKTEFKSDIFGFGNLVYMKDPKLWEKVKKDWNNIFLNIEVDIKPTVHIINAAFLR